MKSWAKVQSAKFCRRICILKTSFNDAYAKAKRLNNFALKANNKLQLAEAIRSRDYQLLLEFDGSVGTAQQNLTLHQQLNSEYVLNNLQAIGMFMLEFNWLKSFDG